MLDIIASDLHGSAACVGKLAKAIERDQPRSIYLLGDILYHGPRNALPEDYNPSAVIELLAPYADRIFAVRGNCDSEVDQMVLPFPMMADYALLNWCHRRVFMTHGHIYNPNNLPKLSTGDILLTGHTHVAAHKILQQGILYLNPGSVSIPKENTGFGYMTFDGQTVSRKSLVGQTEWEIALE